MKREIPRGVLRECPHGDITCPCADGDSCHYEGPDPMTCPNPPMVESRLVSLETGEIVPTLEPAGSFSNLVPHCHAEGCRWGEQSCMLVMLQVPEARVIDWATMELTHLGFVCGASRHSRFAWLLAGRPDPSLEEGCGGSG